MSDPQFPKHKSCTNKKKYKTMKDAVRDAGAMKRRGFGHFTTYYCAICRFWHCGHTPLRIIYADRLRQEGDE
jgi:hypothetical protein